MQLRPLDRDEVPLIWTLDQLEVSIRALREVLQLEEGATPEAQRVEVMA